ncbi:hypothetical protein [Aeromonas hydrophila]|uniref:hypothetical protein n=1 Tax=Aeromonas hydrophila TaxID=644 RepID=UPI0036DA9CE2
MKSINQIKKEARSESMNKWIGRLEDELDFQSYGQTPTERMENIIEQIKERIPEVDFEFAEELDQLITSAYFVGAHAGFSRALKRVGDGSITTRKVPNEDRWTLYSYSKQYQITESLPTLNGSEQKATVYIELSEHGFE